jgi:hypothetical protein
MEENFSGVSPIALAGEQREEQRRFHPPASASAYLRDRHNLKQSEQTLAKLRSIGGGPRFSYFGRYPEYREDWLDEYAASRISGPVGSTSEKPALMAIPRQHAEPPAPPAALAGRRGAQQKSDWKPRQAAAGKRKTAR